MNQTEVQSQTQMLTDSIQVQIWTLTIKIIIAVGVMIIFYLLIKIAVATIESRIRANSITENDEYTNKLAEISGTLVFYILMAFNILISFQLIGLNLGFLIAGISFAIGFALKEILGNMISGLMILTNKKYKIGDTVQIQGDLNVFGKIDEITIRYSIIKTFDKRRVIVPNKELVSTPVKTFSIEKMMRINVEFYVYFNTDIKAVSTKIKEFINGHEFVANKDFTYVVVSGFGQNELILNAYLVYETGKKWSGFKIKNYLRKEIYAKYPERGLDMAYPHISVGVDANDKTLLGTAMFGIDSFK